MAKFRLLFASHFLSTVGLSTYRNTKFGSRQSVSQFRNCSYFGTSRLARSNRLRVGLALCRCNGDPALLWNLKRKQFSCRHFKVNLVGYYRVNEILLLQSAIVLCKLFQAVFAYDFFMQNCACIVRSHRFLKFFNAKLFLCQHKNFVQEDRKYSNDETRVYDWNGFRFGGINVDRI